jgi:hypothetical protein
VFLLVFLAAFALARPLEPEDQAALARLSPRLASWTRWFAREPRQ